MVQPIVLDPGGFKRGLRAADDILFQGQSLAAIIQALSNLASTGQGVIYPTLAALNADINHSANTLGVVYNDGSNSGYYVKSGASGAGGWTLSLLTNLSQAAAALSALQAQAAANNVVSSAGQGRFASVASAAATAISAALMAVTIAFPGCAATTWKPVTDPGGALPTYQFRDSASPARVWQFAEGEMRPELIGAAGNTVELYDGNVSTTNGVSTLTSATAAFTSADVGKFITVIGALSTGPGKLLKTTIAAVNSASSVQLSAAADTAVTGRAGTKGQIADGSYSFYDPNVTFASTDVGSFIRIAGADLNGSDLKTWITAVNTSTNVVTLAHQCAYTVTAATWSCGALTHYGQEDTAYITDAATYCSTFGAKLVLSRGRFYGHASSIAVSGFHMLGEGGKVGFINPANCAIRMSGDGPRVSGVRTVHNTNSRFAVNMTGTDFNMGVAILPGTVNAEVSSCVIERPAQMGIIGEGVQGAKVFANKIIRSWADGTHFNGGSRFIEVFGNFVHESGDDSYECTSYCNQQDNSSGTVTGVANAYYGGLNKYMSYVGNVSFRALQGSGMNGVEGAVLDGNIFVEIIKDGVNLQSDGGFGTFAAKDVTVSNCKFYNCTTTTTTTGLFPINVTGRTGGGYDVGAAQGAATPTYYSFACERIRIIGCLVRGGAYNSQFGLNINGVNNNVEVSNSTFYGLGSSSYSTGGVNIQGTSSEVSVLFCRFQTIYGQAIYCYTQGTGHFRIQGNHVFDCYGSSTRRAYDFETVTTAGFYLILDNTYEDGPTYSGTTPFYNSMGRQYFHFERNFVNGYIQPKLGLMAYSYNSSTSVGTYTSDLTLGGSLNVDFEEYLYLANNYIWTLRLPALLLASAEISVCRDYNDWTVYREVWRSVLVAQYGQPNASGASNASGTTSPVPVSGTDYIFNTSDSSKYFKRQPMPGCTTNRSGNGTALSSSDFALSFDGTYVYVTITAPASGNLRARVKVKGLT